MNAYIFPGQGAQFVGMGLDLYEKQPVAQEMFENANQILGFPITDIMFEGNAEDLKETKVTQPAIFLHSVILSKVMGDKFKPDMVAGHSLGEFSALVANGTDSAQQTQHRDTVEQLYKAIHQLPKTDAALVLLYLDELSYRQMAEVLGISESNVGVKLNRAKKTLNELMNGRPHES